MSKLTATNQDHSVARRPNLSPSEEEALFCRYRRHRDPHLREQIILQFQNLVRYVAWRFGGRGEPMDDVVQVGVVGLINAIDRYEPGRGVRFTTFAMPTIVGEIQRYFRDKAWSMKAPRRMKEIYQAASGAQEMLSRRLGRLPSVQEIALAIDESEENTLRALELEMVHNIASLDSRATREGESVGCLGDVLGYVDKELDAVPDRADLESAIDTLEPRQVRVLVDSVICGMSQREIAAELNISQMQVCRLLRRTMKRMRQCLSLP